jgi:membrane protease YdiL (CAAX protease family)
MKLIATFSVFLCLARLSQAFVAPQCSRLQNRHFAISIREDDKARLACMRNVDASILSVSTRLQMQSSGDISPEGQNAGINWKLVLQSAANQALIGSNIWTGGGGYEILTQKAQFGIFGVLLGVAGCVPLLALSRRIETSESYLVSGLNLSTNIAVLRLFGDTPKPISALLVSAFLSVLTGVVEETTFRGQLIPVFSNNFGSGDIMVGAFLSTVLFAILHTNPLSFFTGDADSKLDNFVLLALQLVNGSAFCFMYLATGNLAVPIIAHALYDFYTFYKTHMVDVAGQMAYAAEQSLMPKMSRAVEQKWTRVRGPEFCRGVQESFYLMDTNRDGMLSRKEFRVALFSYGINLSPGQSAKVLRRADLNQSGGIDLDEFIEFVGPTGSTGKSVRHAVWAPLKEHHHHTIIVHTTRNDDIQMSYCTSIADYSLSWSARIR